MAKSNSDERYFNFPIQLLNGFMNDSMKILDSIVDYAIYEHSLKLILGSEIENMKDSSNYYKITLGDYKKSLANGKRAYRSLAHNSPKVGLNVSLFWDFYSNDKTEFDKICLLGFLAIKSILGAKPYCKLDNKFWLSRMDGQIKSVNSINELSKEIIQYANEYQTKKIKTALRNNWGLITYSRYTRGFYVSYSISLEQLIYEAEKRRAAIKERQYKQQEKDALEMVLEKIKNERP